MISQSTKTRSLLTKTHAFSNQKFIFHDLPLQSKQSAAIKSDKMEQKSKSRK